eukprot:54751-Hanusia_phi.AAC.1
MSLKSACSRLLLTATLHLLIGTSAQESVVSSLQGTYIRTKHSCPAFALSTCLFLNGVRQVCEAVPRGVEVLCVRRRPSILPVVCCQSNEGSMTGKSALPKKAVSEDKKT